MKSPLQRTKNGAIVTIATVVLAIVGYHFLVGKDWLDALYMVVITVSTVGFGEASSLSSAAKLFTIGVIVIGMSAAAYTTSGFLQLLFEGEFERLLGGRRMRMEIDKLRNHIVVCGFGRIGQFLTEELRRHGEPFVVIDNHLDRCEEAGKLGHLVIQGDAQDENILEEANVVAAKVLVTALPDDASNVFITLTSRNLNDKLLIIARGEYQRTQKKLLQAGADRVILPEAIGAQRIATMITRPSTEEFLELVGDRTVLEVELDELKLPEDSAFVGKTVREMDARRQLGLLIIAIKQSNGDMVFNPSPDQEIHALDTLIIMGRADDLDLFRQQFFSTQP